MASDIDLVLFIKMQHLIVKFNPAFQLFFFFLDFTWSSFST